jgi:hypothetical protein
MDVRLPIQKQQGPKIKTVPQSHSDELSVNLKSKESKEPKTNTVERLRSGFEEAISSLRMGPSTEDINTKLEFDINLGECPLALSNYHSILQTLLKLMWETHKRKYGAIAQGFKSALEEKIANTQKLVVQKRQLKESNDSLLKTFQTESVRLAIMNFEEKWSLELQAARDKFQDPTAGIETLVSKAMDFCGRIKVEPSQVDVGDLLQQTDTALKLRSEQLWKLWDLHVKRHKSVFQGNLASLESIDKDIQTIDLGAAQAPEQEQEIVEEIHASTETEQAYKAWMEFVKLLGILKIDYDIRITMAKKATTWMSSKITESLHAELSRACMEILEAEQTSILKNREKMKEILSDVGRSQAVIEAEIKRACNNITSQYSSALSHMQLTCDLSLEAARETLYAKATALVTKKSFRI